jgi:hypothetical protein
MKESHNEGLAIHVDPESCGFRRKAGDRSVDRGKFRPGIELRKYSHQGADTLVISGRQHLVHRYCEVYQNPAQSETQCMFRNTLCENREIPGPPWAYGARGRVGKSKDPRR